MDSHWGWGTATALLGKSTPIKLSTGYYTKGQIFFKKNPALGMIVQIILIRILEFKILQGTFKIISSKQAILQMRKVGLRRPQDLLKTLQLTSIPWDWDRNLQVLVHSWRSR